MTFNCKLSYKKHIENLDRSNFYDVLQKIKRRLTSGDASKQKAAIHWLDHELTAGNAGRILFVEKLLKSNTIACLCEAIMNLCEHETHLMSAIACLAKFTESEKFYTQNHAAYALDSILRIAHFMIKQENESQSLVVAVKTVAEILDGMTRFEIPLSSICRVDQLLTFLKNLQDRNFFGHTLQFSVAEILYVILRCTSSEMENDGLALAAFVFEKTLDAMGNIAKECFHSKQKAMKIICCLCAMGISFRPVDDDETRDTGDRDQRIIAIEKSIYVTMMEVVLPWLITMTLDPKHSRLYQNFVLCLKDLYESRNVNLTDLSNNLLRLGYLEILPQLTQLPLQGLRVSTFVLISRMLTTLGRKSLAIENWPGGPAEFQRFLANNLISLPLDLKEWPSLMGHGGDKADALLVLYYYSFQRPESDAASLLPYLVAYVLSFPKQQPVAIMLVKMVWFLVAISAASHPSLLSVPSYDTAMTRLKEMLQIANLQQYYTHHPAVLMHGFLSNEFSEKLRSKIVSLWLESGGDVESLIQNDTRTISSCLLDTIQTESPEVVDLAMGAIAELVKDKEAAEELSNVVWEIMPGVLTNYGKHNGKNVRSMLQIAGLSVPKNISSSTVIRAAYLLLKIFIEEEEDLPLITSTTNNAYLLLLVAIEKRDFRVLRMCVNDPAILRKLLSYAFAKDNTDLSILCLKCLSFIIHCQAKFSVPCYGGVKIELKDFASQLKIKSKSVGILPFLYTLTIQNIEEAAISFSDISNDEERDKIIIALYMQLHIVHAENGTQVRNLVYRSLCALMNYCSNNNYQKVLSYLTHQHWTLFLIEMVVDSKQITSPFVSFLKSWLSYRKDTYCKPDYQPYRTLGDGDVESGAPMKEFEHTLDMLGRHLLSANPEPGNWGTFANLSNALMLFEALLPKDLADKLKEKYN